MSGRLGVPRGGWRKPPFGCRRHRDKICQLPPLSAVRQNPSNTTGVGAEHRPTKTAIVGGPTTFKGLRTLSRRRHCITNRLPNTCWQQLMQILINNMQRLAVH